MLFAEDCKTHPKAQTRPVFRRASTGVRTAQYLGVTIDMADLVGTRELGRKKGGSKTGRAWPSP
jgi:hypothetical protein